MRRLANEADELQLDADEFALHVVFCFATFFACVLWDSPEQKTKKTKNAGQGWGLAGAEPGAGPGAGLRDTESYSGPPCSFRYAVEGYSSIRIGLYKVCTVLWGEPRRDSGFPNNRTSFCLKQGVRFLGKPILGGPARRNLALGPT